MPNDYLKTFPQYVMPKKGMTALAGVLANIKTPAIKNYLIRYFVNKYQVNMNEAVEENPFNYKCFNDFFIRHLKPECRPLASSDLISPVDGYVSEIGHIRDGQLLQAKGKYYSVRQLLECTEDISSQFNTGAFATLYLSPKDYHRVHMPIDATLKAMTYIPGKLFSVQPTTARVVPKLFAINERLAVYFNTSVGLMAMVMVGAAIVGGIGTSWSGHVLRHRKRAQFLYEHHHDMNREMKRGGEMGYFKLGSTVILLFAEGNAIDWQSDLHARSRIEFGAPLGAIK